MTSHLTLSLLLVLSCSLSQAADDSRVRRGLEDVTAAQEQTRTLMNIATTSDQKERIRYIQVRLTSAKQLLEESLGGGGGYPPIPPPSYGGNIEIYQSDSCSGSLVGTANVNTNCSSKFSTAGQAWGIRVNGECVNIADTTAVKACESFKAASDGRATLIYASDSCSSNAIAAISSNSSCENLEKNSTNAWGIKIGDTCHNIQDTSPAKACNVYKAASNPAAIEIYASDSCSSSLTAIVDYNTRCESLRGLPQAWGIKINGQCQNISDTDIVTACERYR